MFDSKEHISRTEAGKLSVATSWWLHICTGFANQAGPSNGMHPVWRNAVSPSVPIALPAFVTVSISIVLFVVHQRGQDEV